jgi:hypothetical protein
MGPVTAPAGPRFRTVVDHVQVSVPVGGDAHGLRQTTTLMRGAPVPVNLPAEQLAHLLSVRMIEPVDANNFAA